jgi:hypothetical protein
VKKVPKKRTLSGMKPGGVLPNGRKFHFAYRRPVKGNQYGRQEQYYTCEDCSGCPYAGKCKKRAEIILCLP